MTVICLHTVLLNDAALLPRELCFLESYLVKIFLIILAFILFQFLSPFFQKPPHNLSCSHNVEKCLKKISSVKKNAFCSTSKKGNFLCVSFSSVVLLFVKSILEVNKTWLLKILKMIIFPQSWFSSTFFSQ